jgi:signal peptidase I
MSPTILPGDRLFADKTVGHPGGTRLWHGALALFVNPNDRTAIFIKRVIGLPGDRVEITGHCVSVNGRALTIARAAGADCAPRDLARQECTNEHSDHGGYSVLWPTQVEDANDAAREHRTWTVPDGQVFVLGDNRGTAVDSRRIGMVPLVDVLGVARQVWFSWSPTGGVRWERVGKPLD